jgi:hypothetical protein
MLYEEEMRLRIELRACELRHGGQRATRWKGKLFVRVAMSRDIAVSNECSASEDFEERWSESGNDVMFGVDVQAPLSRRKLAGRSSQLIAHQ